MINKILTYFAIKRLYKEREQTKFDKALWNARKPLIQTQNQIEEEKKELTIERIKTKFPSCSKIFASFLFINFTILEIFIGWVTIKTFSLALSIGVMPDFTPLVTLISAVIGQTFSYGIYAFKSKAENTKDGIIFESAMAEYQQNTNNDEEGVG